MKFIEHEKNGLLWLTAPNIKARHGFTTRFGGVSRGHLASLDLGTHRGDSEENVRENYRRLGAALGIDCGCMAFTRQVHGNAVRAVTEADIHTLYTEVPYEADGIVTATPGLALICFTADCVPVLLWDGKNRAIAAVHCGWRSSVADILAGALTEMEALGAERGDIHAAIGPAISRCCFQVGGEVIAAAEALIGPCPELWEEQAGYEGKFLLDLKGVNRRRLVQLGVPEENIALSDDCTMCLHEKYWSHRKTAGRRGSQGAVIVLD